MTPPPAGPPAAGGTRTDVDAYECLRSAIIRGQLQPAERLVEADISARFGLRPAAVRKALIQLEHEGLVARERYRGAHVRRFTQIEVEEILEANAALKGAAIRLAARRATPQQVEMMRATLGELADSYAAGQLLEAEELTARLHHQMLEISGQRVIQRLSASLSAQMARFQYLSVMLPGASQESFRLQAQIVDAIAAGDEEAAADALSAHFAHTVGVLRAHAGHISYGLVV